MPAKKKARKKTAKKKATRRKVAKRKATRKKATRRKVTKKKATKKKKAKKKVVRKKMAKKKVTKKKAKKKAKRKPNPAFMRPWTPSVALSAIVGSKPLPRTQVTKKIWAYIKKHGLQDRFKRTMINADDKLKRIFGGKTKVSMFEMTKLVSKHLY